MKAPDDERGLDDHETNLMRALAAIHATIDKENFEVIRDCLNPRDAYLKLCKHHDDAGGLSTANLFSDLVTLKLSSDGDLKEHIHQFRKLHNDLLSILSSTPDMKISEPFVAIILINSLPSDYTPLVQSLLTSFKSLTLARLYSLLNIEATRNSNGSKGDTALSVNRSNVGKKFKKREHNNQNISKDVITCSLGHPGHSDENCKTRQWREFKTYQDSLKEKKTKDEAKLTLDDIPDGTIEPDADISYYDTAFSVMATTLPTVMDTGASSHMFGDKSTFRSMHPSPPSKIAVASKGGAIFSRYQGCVEMGSLNLKNVLYSNELTGNLISVGRLCDDGYTAIFRQRDGFILNKQRQVILRMTRDPCSDRLWHPNVTRAEHAYFTHRTKADLATLWHHCLGHAHPDAVIHHLKVHHKIHLSRTSFRPCDACTVGKLRQAPSTSPFHRSSRVLDVIHSDLIGPIHPATNSGYKYILTFIDDFTRYNHIYLLKNKSDVFVKFKQYKALIENQTGSKIVKLKTDRGGEYSSGEFIKFLADEGIQTERGPAERPMANSISERFNWTLLSRI